MAKMKRDIIVRAMVDNATEARSGVIHVWANGLIASDVMSIGGVYGVDVGKAGPAFVYVDARYDVGEVAAEIEELLLASVPDVFRTGLDNARDSEEKNV